MTPLVEALSAEALPRKSRLTALLDHLAEVEDPRDVRRILHPLPEVLLLVAAWGAAHLDFLRRHLPYEHGVPGERWLTILMNRINPALFAAAFAGWVRESCRRFSIAQCARIAAAASAAERAREEMK